MYFAIYHYYGCKYGIKKDFAPGIETATEAVLNMKVGWNLGNTLDAHGTGVSGSPSNFETYWGQPITNPALMQMMHLLASVL